jgi:hypothetical protein
MKKGTSFYIFIAILGITFSSCNFKLKESNNYNKPDVDVTNNQVTIVIPCINTKTKYINVYRRDKINDEVVNLGVLFHPVALDQDHKNYFFYDTFVERTHTYDYRVRYCINNKYYYTDWSEEKEIPDSTVFYADGSYSFAYNAQSAELIIDNPNGIYTMEFSGTITEPDFPDFNSTDYKPALIVSSETTTQTLLLTPITSGSPMKLTDFLPSIFLDTDIKIEGIVGQKIEYDDPSKPQDEQKIKSIIWTQPAAIAVDGYNPEGTINIPSITGIDGHDYSRNAKISQ